MPDAVRVPAPRTARSADEDEGATGSAGRRQRLAPEERREQLVAATVAVLAEQGYAGTSAEAIARRAGVSKGLLWHYFTDLDELFEVTARRTLSVLSAATAAAIDLTRPAPVVIRAAVHAAAGLRRTHAAERRALQEIVLNLRTADGDLRLGPRALDELYADQAAIFRRGQEEGSFRDTLDPRLLAVTYQGAVDGMLGYLDAHPGTDAVRHAETVAEVLLGGIVERRPGEPADPVSFGRHAGSVGTETGTDARRAQGRTGASDH